MSANNILYKSIETKRERSSIDMSPMDMDTSSRKFADKTLQDYEVLSVIGNGAFGTCYKVRDKSTGELYAWKGMDYDELSDAQKESLVSEISVLRQLQHPNIVQYYHHLVNHEAKSVYIVMECCEGGDLAQLIRKARTKRCRFEEKYIWRVLFQICKALQVCHNKIREGTILHRDIKPANIFLDAEGNAKLGDFGLARMLRRDENFAATFVGTPYYMSPEIVKGIKYDRKSDVWAVGCLIYELCALRTPFKGRAFEQLSLNISNGKFSSIPEVYSADMQQIISFMLEVDNDQRPGIEVVTRHPLLVRNINDLGNEYPTLLPAEVNFYVEDQQQLSEQSEQEPQARCKLLYSSPLRELSSTMYTEQYSFNEDYGQRRLSISGVFTPDLRNELFYSAKRRVFPNKLSSCKLQQSDPTLYESICREEYSSIDANTTLLHETIRATNATNENSQYSEKISPGVLTQNVFDRALQTRLHGIRAQESLLKQRALELDEREKRLNQQEIRLQQLERNLLEKERTIKSLERARLPLPSEAVEVLQQFAPKTVEPPPPPPVPPRKAAKHDDTYCTIEPNDTLLQPPTVAKLNLAALLAAKPFSQSLRKVTFQRSPQKLVNYDIENMPPPPPALDVGGSIGGVGTTKQQMLSSVSSKGSSDDSGDSNGTTQRRKSILSIFGLSRSKESTAKQQTTAKATAAAVVAPRQPLAMVQRPPSILINKPATGPPELTNMWTKEQKRAAFDMLAAMNAAAEQERRGASRHRFRQSVRERNTLHRNRTRRSLIVGHQQQQTFSVQTNAQMLI